MANQRSRGSDDENDYSGDGKSPMPQPPDRPASASPAVGMNGLPAALNRQGSDYYMSMNGNMAAVPAHMRAGMQPSPRSQSPVQYPLPVNGQAQRPSLTSNPSSGYNPPQILEPPATNGQQQPGSGNNSPHMAGMGWQSPHNGINGNQSNDYSYPDPNTGYAVSAAPAMYYQQQTIQRPHSTGPMDYHNQMRGQEMWAHQQQ